MNKCTHPFRNRQAKEVGAAAVGLGSVVLRTRHWSFTWDQTSIGYDTVL